ncbi:uncharacterized protein LOC132549618 [Ylistrum balloti]|uniref:uncharacterized protein LOC132549618 n=1 Tax=Ylistrum balloti TaxID=509963 RepID=UPI002905A136|nr:uncharacterized protein LOC132549618 [Ylistrum balloti]
MSTDTGKLRVLMALGKIFHCHILVFATRNACSYQGKCIRVECVERKQVNETTEKLSDMQHGFEELVNCRSPPIFLEDGDRIRISLRGGIKLPLGFRKDQMIITFLLEGLQKHIVFPVETQIGNRPVHFGYLDFNRVDGHRELIYETFFDADFTFRKMSQGRYIKDINKFSITYFDFIDIIFLSFPGTTEDQQVTIPIVLERVINTLTTSIPPKDWKFVLRAIIGNSGLNSENIISEAECNHKGDVKEAIYQSLTRWAYKTSLTTTEQKFNAIIQGLLHENFDAIANDLKEKYDKL